MKSKKTTKRERELLDILASSLNKLSKGRSFIFAYSADDACSCINVGWSGIPSDIVYMCEQLKISAINKVNLNEVAGKDAQ